MDEADVGRRVGTWKHKESCCVDHISDLGRVYITYSNDQMRSFIVAMMLASCILTVLASGSVEPTPALDRRQQVGQGGAAVGGQKPTETATTPASISGYTPPPKSRIPEPSNFKKGTILSLSDVKGHQDAMDFASSGTGITYGPVIFGTVMFAAAAGLIFL